MLKKLRKTLRQISEQKFQHFDEFQTLIRKIVKEYGYLFPKFNENRNGSKYVYHFHVQGVYPISLEKEHGSREFIPHTFAKRAIAGIQDVLDYIEINAPDVEAEVEKETTDERLDGREEAPRTLPEPEIPDGDSGG